LRLGDLASHNAGKMNVQLIVLSEMN
jgi:hypothetical protein